LPALIRLHLDQLGPRDIEDFFTRWTAVIPTPFTDADREAGYFFELSMRQVEVSRTLVFDDPRRARGFFESLVTDNIGIGRPHEVHAVFGRDRRGRTTAQPFATRVFSPGTEVKMDFRYKNSRVKQYLKEGRALRIETVFNKPADIGVLARLEHLPELVEKARRVNDRLLMIERAGQGCAIGSALFERIHQPYVREGQRTGAFRFGDQRAMALAGALCLVVHAVTGFTNKSLRVPCRLIATRVEVAADRAQQDGAQLLGLERIELQAGDERLGDDDARHAPAAQLCRGVPGHHCTLARRAACQPPQDLQARCE
jgi:hypothetical protein